jgi:hypothetical protein
MMEKFQISMHFQNPVLEWKSVNFIPRYCYFSIANPKKTQYLGKIEKFKFYTFFHQKLHFRSYLQLFNPRLFHKNLPTLKQNNV